MNAENQKETPRMREKCILYHWETEKIFQKSIQTQKNNDTFVFYEGVPTANGLPHVGHALGRTQH